MIYLEELVKQNGHRLVRYDNCIEGHTYMSVFNYSEKYGGTFDSFQYYNEYVVDVTIEYKVKYEDNTGCDDCIMSYLTEEEAEAAIEEDLENVKEYFQSTGYDYSDFGTKTEIWVPGGDNYASWERLWK